jgi:hypothetical protein
MSELARRVEAFQAKQEGTKPKPEEEATSEDEEEDKEDPPKDKRSQVSVADTVEQRAAQAGSVTDVQEMVNEFWRRDYQRRLKEEAEKKKATGKGKEERREPTIGGKKLIQGSTSELAKRLRKAREKKEKKEKND